MGISFYDSDNLEKDFDNLRNVITSVQNKVNYEINTLKSQLEIKPIQKFIPLLLESIKVNKWEENDCCLNEIKIRFDFNEKCSKYLKSKGFNVRSAWDNYYIKFSINEEGLNKAKEIIDILAEKDLETHNQNIEKCASNNETYSALMNLLKRIGISKEYLGYRANRNKQKEWITYNWVSEISSQIPRDYSKSKLEDLSKKLKYDIQLIYDNEIEVVKRKQKEKEKNKKLALLLAKYDLDLDNDWEDLLHVIIAKNKYLYLAYWLERNRGDWSDGYHYARLGLEGFNCESELDNEIYYCIKSCIDDWDGDGRVFRDCEYNYSVLYGIVEKNNPDLYKDFCVVRENYNEY